MAVMDRTSQFKDYVAKVQSTSKPQKRKPKSPKLRGEEDTDWRIISKEYLKDAYNILKHIIDLNNMLSRTRKAYLNVRAENDFYSGQTLSNEQRDEIDIEARKVIRQCADRVQALELLEKKRAQIASGSKNPFLQWLTSQGGRDPSSAALATIAVHHSSITYYLNRRLAEVSQRQKEMQEERIKRQTERARTLGSNAHQEAIKMARDMSITSSRDIETSSSWFGSLSLNSDQGPRIPSNTRPRLVDAEEDLQLSSTQIQQFESENAILLQSMQDMRASVEQAESRLMEISALQMELVAHLTQQNELTDQLYADAVESTAMFEMGNVQLKKAKERMGDSRLYVLLFLIGSSFALLFLHYY